MAHFNNAKPVSCHHPMNMIIRRQRVAIRQYGLNWIETGIYLGKVYLDALMLFNRSDNK